MNYERKNNCLTGRTWRIRMNSPCKFYETVCLWTQHGILLEFHLLDICFIGRAFCAFNGNFSQSSGRGICSLTTSWTWFQQQHFSLVPREISYACTHWISISFLFVFFFFHNSFSKGLFCPNFPPFGIELLRLWDSFTWNQHKQHSPLRSQASLRFGNIKKINLGMNCRNKRIIGL